MQHTLAVSILSFLLLLFLLGATSPLWIRKEPTTAFLARIFVWFVPAGCIVFGGVIIWTGLTDYFSGKTATHWTIITAVLSVVLVGTGSTLLYEFSVKRRMELIEMKSLKQRYADSPWKWNRRWRNNRIEFSDIGEMIFSCLVTVIIISAMALSYVTKRDEILKGFHENRLDSLILLYLLVMGAVCSIRQSFITTIRWKQFKRSSFILSTFPGIIGEKLEGEIQTRTRHVPCNGFDLKLSCLEMDITFRNSIQQIEERVLWEATKNILIEDVRMGPNGLAFPVSFNIPVTAEESDTSSRDRRIHWVLTANGTGSDCCFTAAFKIPVFRSSNKGIPDIHSDLD